MAVPDYQSFMLPVLEILSDGQVYTSRQLREAAADVVGLDEDARRELLPSGKQTLLANRVGWAVTYLVKAGALMRPSRGRVQITERGRQLLAGNPERIGVADLKQFEEFVEFAQTHRDAPVVDDVESPVVINELTPSEQLQAIVGQVDAEVGQELLNRVFAAGPDFLEELAVRLLRTMGYGGPQGKGVVTPRSGDAGLDGIIHQDALGLDLVGVQAKCYQPGTSINRPDIQSFVGALQGAQTQRGVFVTTANFTNGARQYAEQVAVRLVLIDGPTLVSLMMNQNLGVTIRETYEIKQIDEDFFEQ